jgi:RNA polymerase sigma-70 factor (ECF subfamily)
MSPIGVSVGPTSVSRGESAKPDPKPEARGPIGGFTPSGGGCRDGAADLTDDVNGGGGRRELPNGLIVAAVRGDRRARDELLALIQPLVLRYCRGKLGRQESVLGSADDVAQEVCVAVVSALGSYQPAGLSFRAFVYGIAKNKVADAFRAIGRNRTEPVAEPPDVPVAANDPEQHALTAERSAALGALLAHLTPRQREVLVLRVAVGLSAEEAAQAIGSTAGTVRVTQHRAVNRLRRLLQQDPASAEMTLDSVFDDAAPELTPTEDGQEGRPNQAFALGTVRAAPLDHAACD